MLKIDTSNILVICGGAFVGLDKIIESRVAQHPLGFGADIRKVGDNNLTELYKQMHPDDLIRYGLIPEFIGRLPIQVALDNLTEEELMQVVTEPKNSIIKQYTVSMEMDGVELEFLDEAISAVAAKALKQKTGARGIRAIVEAAMIDIMYDIPSIKGLKKVVINKDVIENGVRPEIIELGELPENGSDEPDEVNQITA